MNDPHWPARLVRAYGAQPWLIEGTRAAQLIEALRLRAEFGLAATPLAARAAMEERGAGAAAAEGGAVAVLPLHGTLAPRLSGLDAMSGDFTGLDGFQRAFEAQAARTDLRALVLSIDSPGGQVDLVPETAAMVRAARREDRPIVAVANTCACSAAYWIASAADEIVVSPSAQVGSIGVFTIHQDISEALAAEGVRMTLIRSGPRKAETHPFGPLEPEAAAALQARVSETYSDFVAAVAANRGVAEAVVRADPESGEAHFGGGRAYNAREAVRLGMADRVESLSETLARLTAPAAPSRSAAARRRRMALL